MFKDKNGKPINIYDNSSTNKYITGVEAVIKYNDEHVELIKDAHMSFTKLSGEMNEMTNTIEGASVNIGKFTEKVVYWTPTQSHALNKVLYGESFPAQKYLGDPLW